MTRAAAIQCYIIHKS